MQAMGTRSLRYPGGEEANSYQWAPPPYGPTTKPRAVLTTTYGFPGGDFLFYNSWRREFQVLLRMHTVLSLIVGSPGL